MTEQLMEDLTNEEHERLMLMSEHAVAPPLSPAAQAVLEAYQLAPIEDELTAAAVLRAAADQMVVPLPQTPSEYDIAQYDGREEAIANLLNIAAELEA
jgi:hypothetical protein